MTQLMFFALELLIAILRELRSIRYALDLDVTTSDIVIDKVTERYKMYHGNHFG